MQRCYYCMEVPNPILQKDLHHSKKIKCVFLIDPCLSSPCGKDKTCVRQSGKDVYCVCPSCSDVKSPHFVCASDGSTQASECHIKKKACVQKENIFLINKKPCGNFFVYTCS